ncbi:unnamed protein product [Thlaspi arvense]|uniref:Uncharacterized protein n=1 Tax=Thlaspi arvense TaxID=13288 RepID=A0AAU9RI41_THLAR|nr:unnamed protein product [Thlaspi arvense]
MNIISAISGGITDLSFHAVGYAWQIVNCFLTASYSSIQSGGMGDDAYLMSFSKLYFQQVGLGWDLDTFAGSAW